MCIRDSVIADPKGRQGQSQYEDGADDADIQALAGELDGEALAAGDGQAVGDAADALMDFAGTAPGAPQALSLIHI